MANENLVELACRATREEFASLVRCHLLVSTSGTELKHLAKREVRTHNDYPCVVAAGPDEEDDEFPTVLASFYPDELAEEAVAGGEAALAEDEDPVVLPVRKASKVFPNRISVGRTRSTNDIVIEDARISKLHAFFEIGEAETVLHDAGSTNGTWVGGKKIRPNGPPEVVASGDVVIFAGLMFSFLDAGTAWERIRAKRGRPR